MKFTPLDHSVEWLFQNGAPALRWRVASELVKDSPSDRLARLTQERLEFPLVQSWLNRLELMVNYHLPLIHDLYILAYFPETLLNQETAGTIDDILTYILDPRFRAVPFGYGYAWIKEQHTCYHWGWSPHLPGFHGFETIQKFWTGMLIQRMELLGRFPQARSSSWFQEGLRHLERFRTDQGRLSLPSGYLRELPSGYFVTGAYMGLGENRRRPIGLELESTFRMVKILQAR